MAEFLIQAKPHWMDVGFTPTVAQQADYNARSQKGDIVIVRPDGWSWGNEERLPNYIVVKVPSLAIATARTYEAKVWDIVTQADPVLLKKYRYAVPVAYVDTVIAAGGVATITKAKMTGQIIDKSV